MPKFIANITFEAESADEAVAQLRELAKLAAEELPGLSIWGASPDTGEDAEIAELAKQNALVEDGVLEIDTPTIISQGNANGAYVQAWLWVDFAGTKFDKTPTNPESKLSPDAGNPKSDPSSRCNSR